MTVLIALTLSLATFVTAHVVLSIRLALYERPRWRGLVAFVVPPLAVLWALRAGFRRTAAVWISAVAIYASALILAVAS